MKMGFGGAKTKCSGTLRSLLTWRGVAGTEGGRHGILADDDCLKLIDLEGYLRSTCALQTHKVFLAFVEQKDAASLTNSNQMRKDL